MLTYNFRISRDSSVGRAEDCSGSWHIKAILRSVVQIRLAGIIFDKHICIAKLCCFYIVDTGEILIFFSNFVYSWQWLHW